MALEIGQPAPQFELKNQHGEVISLSSLRGKKAVLIFYPFAFSGICGGELAEIRDRIDDFENNDVVTVAISVDHVFSLRAWADRDGYQFALLSDYWPHGAVAKAYDVFNEEVGCAERGTFVVDRDGVLRWKVRHGIPDARQVTDYLDALAAID
jgi:mycoredoxin-dependent peroxiredoxin